VRGFFNGVINMIWGLYYAALGIACAVAVIRGFESE